jgi:hypothetical protein
VSIGEFSRTLDAMNNRIDAGFAEVRRSAEINTKTLDRIEDMVLSHDKKFAVLESQTQDTKMIARKWGAGIATLATAAAELARVFFHKGS